MRQPAYSALFIPQRRFKTTQTRAAQQILVSLTYELHWSLECIRNMPVRDFRISLLHLWQLFCLVIRGYVSIIFFFPEIASLIISYFLVLFLFQVATSSSYKYRSYSCELRQVTNLFASNASVAAATAGTGASVPQWEVVIIVPLKVFLQWSTLIM